jgi:hypothetical protein
MTNIEYTVSLHVTVSFQTDETNLDIFGISELIEKKEHFHRKSNLLIRSPLLSSHLYKKVTIFLSCHRKFHMN